jgi:hypothetical protein
MCNRCGVEKPKTTEYYHWKNFTKKKFRKSCKLCEAKIKEHTDNKKWHNRIYEVEAKPQPTIPQTKDSEYHKNVERTDTNRAFFLHLCSGNNHYN